jgi:UDP-N-acetylglucosamine acyltransferase
VIGSNCLIQAYSHIAHDCEVGDYCIFSNSTTLAGHITIGNYVVLAGLVAIHQFVKVGSHAFVTGGSLERKDVPPYVKAAREPLSYAGINSVGLRRRGFSSEKINEIQEIYRVLFVKHNNVTKALDMIEAEFAPTEIRDEIVDFIRNSNRGVMKGFGSGS